MTARSKVALRLAYLGSAYEGFQSQPSRRTVQTTVVRALHDTGVLPGEKCSGFSASGRTDKGVHAIDAVVAFDVEGGVSSLLAASIANWRQIYGCGHRRQYRSRLMHAGMP